MKYRLLIDFRSRVPFPDNIIDLILLGGKVEAGESPEEALCREIREELEVEVNVGDLIDTIEYDYPAFHLSMKCYACTIAGGSPHLLEHEAARWLSADQLDSVAWLPADITLIPKIAGLL